MPHLAKPLPDGVTDTFTHLCHICGATVHVVESQAQPHRCRIVIPERTDA